jgi:hypothetical protein
MNLATVAGLQKWNRFKINEPRKGGTDEAALLCQKLQSSVVGLPHLDMETASSHQLCARFRSAAIYTELPPVNQVSIISDRRDYHSVFVRNGEDVVELVSTNPWRGLFRALLKLKVLQFKRRFHAERQTVVPDPPALTLPIHRFGLSPSGNLRGVPPRSADGWVDRKGNRQVVRIDGQTVNELRGPAITKANPSRRAKERTQGDRPQNTSGELRA